MVFDADELNMMFGDDPEIFTEIFADFEASYMDMINEIKVAIEGEDVKGLEISAHTLKGVLATFCAIESKEFAYQLEQLGHNGSFEGAMEIFSKLEKSVPSLIETLKSHSFSAAA